MPKPPGLPFSDADIDPEILPLVRALNRGDQIATLGCCSGHGTEPAYLDVAVAGLEGMRWFVSATNAVSKALGDTAMLDVAVNWSDDVPTACDFEKYPDWIMLCLFIEEEPNAGPSAARLGQIAELYQKHATVDLG